MSICFILHAAQGLPKRPKSQQRVTRRGVDCQVPIHVPNSLLNRQTLIICATTVMIEMVMR